MSKRSNKPRALSDSAISRVITPGIIADKITYDATLHCEIGDNTIQLGDDLYVSGHLQSTKPFSIIKQAALTGTVKAAHLPDSLAESVTFRTTIPAINMGAATLFGRMHLVLLADILVPLHVPYTVYVTGAPDRIVTDFFTVAGAVGSIVKSDFQMIETITTLSGYHLLTMEFDIDLLYNKADIRGADFTFRKKIA